MIRKLTITISAILIAVQSWGQYGYIKLYNDAIVEGHLRRYVSFKDGHQGIELWKTKNDKEPRKIPKTEIQEYAIKKDTFKVFHDYYSFYYPDIYFKLIDGKRRQSGKINVYVLFQKNLDPTINDAMSLGTIGKNEPFYKGGGSDIYILERRDGFFRDMPLELEKLEDALLDFFPERVLNRYKEEKGRGKIKYKSIPKLVKFYNGM
ncbi:MAG: hypothetical protein R2820_03970 [Cyclobacteriaceae bacterium]